MFGLNKHIGEPLVMRGKKERVHDRQTDRGIEGTKEAGREGEKRALTVQYAVIRCRHATLH